MRYIYLLILPMLVSASLLDFNYLKEAKEAYNNKNYTKAQESYAKVDSDEARFNEADALYRQKKYKEAIEIYKSIKEPKLESKKLHNIGNSYAQIGKLDESIKSYKEALKLKEDKDIEFNLELLKKIKKEQKKKQNKKSKKDNKNQKDNSKKSSKDKKEADKQKSEKDKDNKAKDKKEAEKKRKNQENNQTKQIKEQNSTKTPISNMEERKWEKMLNQRGVNTLMIPLNKGKKDNEDKPW